MNDNAQTPCSLTRPAAGPEWIWEFCELLEDLDMTTAEEGCSAAVLRPDEEGIMQPTTTVVRVYSSVILDTPWLSTVIPAGTTVKADWHKPTAKWWLAAAWRIGV